MPFVTKSGGHSNWSTIGDDGLVVDLAKYSGVEVDPLARTAKLKGSILSKSVAVRLADAGYFAGTSISMILCHREVFPALTWPSSHR